MLTSGITDTLEIPHEPGQTITIRKLPWKQLAKARKARKKGVFSDVKDMGADVLAALPSRCAKGCGEEKHKGDCPPVEERSNLAEADPTEEFDQDTLLHAGITEWTYEKDGKGVPCNEANINDMDEVTAKWAFAEIVKFNTAPSEEEQGK